MKASGRPLAWDWWAAGSANDYLRGVFAYRVAPDIQHGRALFVECLAVSGLFSPLDVAVALLDGIEPAARENRCRALIGIKPIETPAGVRPPQGANQAPGSFPGTGGLAPNFGDVAVGSDVE